MNRGKHRNGHHSRISSMRRPALIAVFTAFSVLAATPAKAQLFPKPEYPTRVCEAARDVIESDRELLQAMRNAFGKVNYWGARRNDPRNCLYPVKLLKFHQHDLLLTVASEPGELCGNCRARVSAHFLRNRPGTPKVLKREINFALLGKFGDPGTVSEFTIGGNEGFGVESAVSIKGMDFKKLSFFILTRNTISELKSEKPILSAFDTTDRVAKGEAVAINSSWRVDPVRTIDLIVDYEIRRGEVNSDVQVIWRRDSLKLVPLAGQPPQELRPEVKAETN